MKNVHRLWALLTLFAAAVLTAGLLTLAGTKPAWAADSSFVPAPNSPFPVGRAPTTVTSADFNGDGKVDLAAQNRDDKTVSVLLGNGDGTLQERTDFAVGENPSSVTNADFNGDGNVDLAASNFGNSNLNIPGSVSMLVGKGDGNFQEANNLSMGPGPSSVISADFNGDSKADLATSNYLLSMVAVRLGNGDGSFQDAQFFAIEQNCPGTLCSAMVGPRQIISADFNGDSKADLATANLGLGSCAFCNPGGVSVLLGNGNGTFQTARVPLKSTSRSIVSITAVHAGPGTIVDLAATDLNNDVVWVLIGNGDGTFEGPKSLGVGTDPFGVTSADLDGDARADDLAVANSGSGNVSVLFNNDTDGFQAAQNFPTGGVGPNFLTSADLNADSFTDLATANFNSNNVSVLLNTPPPPDTTAPSTIHTLLPQPNGADWTNSNVTVTLNATDTGGSEVKEIHYSTTGAQTSAERTVPGNVASILITSEGETTISYYAVDHAGNTEKPKPLTVNLDKSAPTSSATATDSASNNYTSDTWTSKDVTVELSADDGTGSDLKEISYSINGGATKTYNSTEKIFVDSEGVSQISYFAIDKAGNQESPAKTFTVKLDESAPTLDTDNSDGTDGITPDNGATGVGRDAKPKATFSDLMDLTSLRTSAKLYQWNAVQKVWQLVSTGVSVKGKTATLDPYPSDPNKLLAANTKFKVTVSRGATNLAGLSMSRPKSWTFTTRSK